MAWNLNIRKYFKISFCYRQNKIRGAFAYIGRHFFCFLCIYFFLYNSFAGSFEVAPTRLLFDDQNKIKSLTIKNLSDEELILSIKVYAWDQIDNKDNYIETNDLLVTPPIVKIKGKSSQIIRIANLENNIQKEKAFRLYAHEVLPKTENEVSNLKMALRIGIPIFVNFAQKSKGDLKWSAVDLGENIRIKVANNGKSHEMISKINIKDKNGNDIILKKDFFAYVLPDKERYWDFSKQEIKLDELKNSELYAETRSGENLASLLFENA